MRKGKTLLVIVLSIVITATILSIYVKKERVSEVKILVAKQSLESGSIINKDNVGYITVDSNSKLKNYITKFSDVDGKMLTNTIGEYQIITTDTIKNADVQAKDVDLTLTVSNNISSIKKGDIVNIYSVNTSSKNDKQSEVKEIFSNRVIFDIPKQNNTSKEEIIIKATKEEAMEYLKNEKETDISVFKIN